MKINVAILGAGGLGETVIKHLRDCPQAGRIVAYDIRKERLEELKKLHNVDVSADLNQVLADPTIRVVFITSSNDSHKALTIAALEAGKAVMCEKPMATTLADAEEMVNAAEHTKGFLQIGFELRYSKLYTKVKDWIDEGLLGQVVNTHCLYCSSVYTKDAWRNKLSAGDTFPERLSHYVDLTRWWIGSEVSEVYSACSPNVVPYTEVRDNYHTTYRFKNGAVSHISYYMNYPAMFRGDPLADSVTDLQLGDGHKLRYIIVGTKGAAETDVFYRHIKRWQFSDTPERMVSDWVENLTWNYKEDQIHYHNTHDQTLDIVRRVAEGLPPKTSARDALQTMRLCFAAIESADEKRSVSLGNQ